MTFTDDFGTTYPEEARKYVKSRKYIDIDRNVLDTARRIAKGSKNTDEAILKVHDHLKSIPVATITAIPSVPAKYASEQVLVNDAPDPPKSLSYNKVIYEVSLLRALNIPSRPVSFVCSAGRNNKMLGGLPSSMRDLYLTMHYGTEVYARNKEGKGKFRLKESWIPHTDCYKIDERTCMVPESKEWTEERQVRDIQRVMPCSRIVHHVDFPGLVFGAINALVLVRNSTHLIDFIDPA